MTNRTKTIIAAFLLLGSLILLGINIYRYFNYSNSNSILLAISNIITIIFALFILKEQRKK